LNYNQNKKEVSWKDLETQNVPMLARSFLKLARASYLIPHLMDVKDLQTFIEQTLPPITNGEIKFYQQQILCKTFKNDTNYAVSKVEPLPSGTEEPEEPALQFNDFLFLLSLIAYSTITSRKTIEDKLVDLYSSKLNLGKIDVNIVDEEYNFEEILNRI